MKDKIKFNVIESSKLLERLGVNYLRICSDGEEPEVSNIKFSDLIPKLKSGFGRALDIANEYLYLHQLEALEVLKSGKNLILISGTGSGKTEAWATYALITGVKVLTIYPTLALASDQIERIRDYYNSVVGSDVVVKVDRPEVSELGFSKVTSLISKALVVISNPAFLMSDIKRIASKSGSILANFLRDVDLIVVDEFDFYGSKGAALLLSIADIIVRYIAKKKPQLVILTATLGNPDVVANALTAINGRESKVIRGKSFTIPNCTYIIYGKDLERIRDYVIRFIGLDNVPSEVKEIITKQELFNKYAYSLINYLRSLGYEVPNVHLDICELLSHYVLDDGVTLVFSNSIRAAERLAARLRNYVSEDLRDKIVVHHHLVPKDVRRRIEELAREVPPKVKVVITVRTLLQGIDIGNVVRVVHYGLPPEVREFKQREGRKGRRRYIPFSESLILPISQWDYSLLSMGIEGLKEYLLIPLEKVYVNVENKYVKLFKALFKLMAGIELESSELELLKSFKLIEEVTTLSGKSVRINDEGLKIWRDFNFYEFGPPYGIPRYVLSEDLRESEEVSRRDLVEVFQPGSIDYSEEAIVVETSRNMVKEVSIKYLDNYLSLYPFLQEALGLYEEIKRRWGESIDLIQDIIRGKVTSAVETVVALPKDGFSRYYERPYRVKWYVESDKVRFKRIDDTLIAYHDSESIELSSTTYGEYSDFTYGFLRYGDMLDDINDLVVGLACIKLILRLSDRYAISFREIMFDVTPVSVKSLPIIYVWEPEASGILELIKWGEVGELLELFREPPKIWFSLIKYVDRRAAETIISRSYGWSKVLELANKVLDYLEGVVRVELGSLGSVRIPRPSKDLGILSLDILEFDFMNSKYVVLTTFDGSSILYEEFSGGDEVFKNVDYSLFKFFSEAIDNDYVVVTGINLSDYVISRKCKALYTLLISNERLVNPLTRLKLRLGIPYVDLKTLALATRAGSIEPGELVDAIVRDLRYGKLIKSVKFAKELSALRTKVYYLTYLLLRNL